jgi:hypothetical protein
MKKTIESISIFLVISLVFTLPFTNTYYDFAKYFLLVSVIQYILTYIYFNYLQFLAEKVKNERIKEYSKQGTEITCPCYLEKKFFLPLKFNESNVFNCLECKKDFSVDISTKTYLQTEIPDLDKSEIEYIKAIHKIQNYK